MHKEAKIKRILEVASEIIQGGSGGVHISHRMRSKRKILLN